MRYHQLTQEQRYQIYPGAARQGRCALKKTGHSNTEIADVIGVHKSTVSRELRRNRGGRAYRPQQAQKLALGRRAKAMPRITKESWALVEKLLHQEWSPEQISGRLKKEQKICISHEWIYQHVLADKCNGGDLYKYLRCQKQQRKRYGTYQRRGDWKVDTILGKDHKQALVTLTGRAIAYEI
jgi:IS30 family transposase